MKSARVALTQDFTYLSPNPLYRPEIDGLRAIAVVAVMVYHFNADLLPGGFLGVDIFFAISGFVVTSSLTGKPGRSGAQYLLGFYANWVKRLIPALVFCAVLTSLRGCFLIDSALMKGSLRIGTASLFGLPNVYVCSGHQSLDNRRLAADCSFSTAVDCWASSVLSLVG